MKVGVEIASAMNLLPKDGQGSTSAYVEVVFDKQRFRTSVKEKDLNPVWDEIFYFNVSDEDLLPELVLEGFVYSTNAYAKTKSFLGKVQIAGTAIVPFSDAFVMHYPLEKRSMFSRVKGELGLKVFFTNDPNVNVSGSPLPDPVDQYAFVGTPLTTPLPQPEREKDERRQNIYRSIPKDGHDQQKNQYQPPPPLVVPYGAGEEMMKSGRMHSSSAVAAGPSSMNYAYAIKETSPLLGGGNIVGGRIVRPDKAFSTYDLVESMVYLFVRVVKARDLPNMDITGSLDPYVEVRVGNYTGKTRMFEKQKNPEWNEVFAFSMDHMQSDTVEVLVMDKDLISDDFVGKLRIEIEELPRRVPPDSPLAPEWHRLEHKKTGEKVKGELMLAVWIGTQADECFPEAWHSDTATSPASPIDSSNIRSKVYHSPRLWYVRVNIIEAQDLIYDSKTRFPNTCVKVRIGQQVFKTRFVQSRTLASIWNEEFMFVAAEPIEDHLVLTVEDRVGPNKDEVIGRIHIPLQSIEKRVDDRIITSRWFDIVKPGDVVKKLMSDSFASKLHLRLCLDGGYHVLDESTNYSSDLRPTARQLWMPPVGLLELGIISAEGLHPNKTREGKGTLDTYCVARYGQKWVRTRTVVNSLTPRYNEQYTWEVFDPATVLTVGVFDNYQIGEKGNSDDLKIGKVRIRLSTLQTGRVYTHSYPLLVLQRSGVKKMGELHLAIRFSSSSLVNIMHIYSRPLLPKMHYIQPLTLMQTDHLKEQAVKVVAARLSRMEPPLRKEVVEYLSDFDSHLWSIRKSRANLGRLTGTFSNVLAIGKWFVGVSVWKNPITTALVHILFLLLACFPEFILPTAFVYMFLIGALNYRFRPQFPPHMNTSISQADTTVPDDLDEEFDTFPSNGSPEILRRRYDRLRTIAGKMQSTVGDLATQGERVQALISWRDPRATAIFMLFCLIASGLVYVTPMKVMIVVVGFYLMRHPRLRGRMPGAALNFFRRLPAMTDSML